MLYDPLCDFQHTLIGDEKIHGRAKTFADRLLASIQLVAGMLIKRRRIAARNVFGEFC
jgi:hypothetical protein